LPEVAQVGALYQDSGRWLNTDARLARDVFVMGFNPGDVIFDLPEIAGQVDVLRRPDTIVVDTASRPEFGSIEKGRRIEIEHRDVTIGGTYRLGTGFVGLGVAITSDLNFVRIFPKQNLSVVSLGLVTLEPGAEPAQVAARLREILPADTQVFTRAEFTDHETNHWVTRTSTGLIFGFGVIAAIAVGLVILNQTLSTQIMRQLPQYATLKAMGCTETYLGGIVVTVAIILSTISYVPAVGLALILYQIIRRSTLLPIEMTSTRMLAVLALAWGISALSAIAALRILRRADPVELF
jgi:putative ABC transport system permease protein